MTSIAAIHAGGPQISGISAKVFVVLVLIFGVAAVWYLIKSIRRDR